ncbi:hypothetical protein Aperf_G00000008617 [Anoplocephala perfoliata]
MMLVRGCASDALFSGTRKNDGGASTPSLPWYYQQLDNANLWSSRSGENSGRARASISERSTLNRQSIRSFFFNGNAKERDSEGEDKRTPIKKSDAGPPVRAPQSAEEPAPPYRTEQGRSRGSSTSSISSYHPDTLSIDDRSVIPPPNPAPDNGVKSSRSRSVSEVSNAELSAAAVNVRERVNDYQQLNQTFFPASSDAVKKPSQQQFPPLDIISQLRQRNSEPTGAWVERVGDRLKEYMDSSSREFDVIMRWILLCGARKETTTSSLNLSIEDIINKLTARDEYVEGDQPKSIASMKSSREGKETLSGGTITKVGGSASAPDCIMLEIGGRNIACFDCQNAADIPWHWMNVEYIIDASERLVKLEDAEKHLVGGRARKVIVVGDTVDIPIIFYPIDYWKYQRGYSVISIGSADSLALATLLHLLQKEFGIIEGIATVITGYSSTQKTVDGASKDKWRLGRGAAQSIIPYNLKHVLHTICQSLPEMADKIAITGFSVPVVSGCVIDLTCCLSRSVGSINELMDMIRNSDTLKTLEQVHLRSQPDWILSKWCPEAPELKKENLPEIKEIVDSNIIAQPNAKQTNEKKNHSEFHRDTQFNMVAENVVHFWQANEDLCVGKDVLSSNYLLAFDVHSCIKLSEGSIIKLIGWLAPLPKMLLFISA